jgi:predicted phage tail protein
LPENITYKAFDVQLNFTVNEPASQIAYSLDGQENVTVDGNTTLTGLSLGEYNVTVYAQDTVGNVGASETIYFNIAEKPEPQPFPTTLIIVASIVLLVVVIGIGLLVYFKKRGHN